MIANLCLLLAPVLAPSTTIQDPQPAPPAQQPPAPPPQDPQPAKQETPPPPQPAPEPAPPPKEEPKPEPVKPEAQKPVAKPRLGYTWGQFDIIRGDGDGYGDGPDGWDIHGSYALGQPGIYLFGGVSHLSGNVGTVSPDTNTLTIGAGMHTPISPVTDFVAEVSFKHANSESNAPSAAFDGAGYGIDVGLRHLVNDQLEVNGGALFTDFDSSDSEATLHFGLVYYASPQVGLCTNVTTSNDLDTLTLGVRYTP
jgi:hypothetical protein